MSIASGQKPILRRVWAPRGTATGGHDPPALSLAVSVWLRASRLGTDPVASGLEHQRRGVFPLAGRSLDALAQQAGAGPGKESVLVLDQAGWHRSQRLHIPPHLQLVPLPPSTPELQPAERLWTYSNTPLVNMRPADLEELDPRQLDRCAALQTDPALGATIQSATHYHWWPADYSLVT
jgi:hypothetical protein